MGKLRLPEEWSVFLHQPQKDAWWQTLSEWFQQEIATNEVYPPADRIFHALERVSPANARVVILGQDPYHGKGQAHGLAFSVPVGVKAPPSLANIQKELARSLGSERPGANPPGDLTSWARQGVLLLNTVLSVRANEAFSHRSKGWEILSRKIIEELGKSTNGIAFLLWGNPAQEFRSLISGPDHLVLETSHPSPLSAYRGFLGCDHFKKVNEWLASRGNQPIDWFASDGLF